jgi:LAO/AO transport system kinase
MMHAIKDISQGVANGDFLLLAKSISWIENREPGVDEFLESLQPNLVPIIGITGPPGAGKSTLISSLIEHWVKDGKRVAILSVDPSSPFHKGAILGDRIRMKDWYMNPNVFIRSLATRGHLGGLINGMIELTTLLQSVGFDVILIETVGVGQSEVEIAGLADTTIVVLVPEAGDEVQMMKSGLMEIAHIFVVNKSDRPDAEAFTNHLLHMMREGLGDAHSIPVVKTIATQQVGIVELAAAIGAQQVPGLSSARKKQLLISKLYQIITAHQMRQLDGPKIENDLAIAMQEKHFNIFTFSRKYYK